MKYKPRRELLDNSKTEEEQDDKRKKAMERVNSYSKYVKEMYWPKVSEQKRAELEQVKESAKSQNVRRSLANDRLKPLSNSKIRKLNINSDVDDHPYNNNEYDDPSSIAHSE